MSKQLIVELLCISAVIIVSVIVMSRNKRNSVSVGLRINGFISGLLGSFLIMAGTVKFFDPFTTMFASQIALSELPFPTLARWAGQLGEIMAGVLFVLSLMIKQRFTPKLAKLIFYTASGLTTVIMLVAVYVHLLPGVPAEVLPLQSKPPVLTLIVLGLVWLNMYLYIHKRHVHQ
ncbi:hypothetical protein [Shewanella saliphila]|uniref:DUF1440 domain-containing protein n=1 Tax=Shewanella saliphila TaxID=2282698 RepID=A0ABQ2Q8X4_9GAMM|nr:hypothetical protein [Shewanella saliphila]MCL1100914.1 hypothetical protein [Shewanella saliphila]GGP57755.1 hypothetical protein GCM10009409_24740 [Shewanella saliphila]